MNRIERIENVSAGGEEQLPGEVPIVSFEHAIRAILYKKPPEEAWCRRAVVKESQARGRSVRVGDGPAVMTERDAWRKYFETSLPSRPGIAPQLEEQLKETTGLEYRVELP